MRQYRYSQRADADMVGIARFSLERFGEKQTEKYLQQIESAVERAIARPTLMRARPELGEGIFSVRCVSHVAFLTRSAPDAAWLVVAVLHGGWIPCSISIQSMTNSNVCAKDVPGEWP